jgi:hypothetical protein
LCLTLDFFFISERISGGYFVVFMVVYNESKNVGISMEIVIKGISLEYVIIVSLSPAALIRAWCNAVFPHYSSQTYSSRKVVTGKSNSTFMAPYLCHYCGIHNGVPARESRPLSLP